MRISGTEEMSFVTSLSHRDGSLIQTLISWIRHELRIFSMFCSKFDISCAWLISVLYVGLIGIFWSGEWDYLYMKVLLSKRNTNCTECTDIHVSKVLFSYLIYCILVLFLNLFWCKLFVFKLIKKTSHVLAQWRPDRLTTDLSNYPYF